MALDLASLTENNKSDQIVIGFSFASDWFSRWRKFFRPITGRCKAKPKQSRITFNTQLKIALNISCYKVVCLGLFHPIVCIH